VQLAVERAQLAQHIARYPLGRRRDGLEALAHALFHVVPNNLDFLQHVVHVLL
jgi:hypothetical protein